MVGTGRGSNQEMRMKLGGNEQETEEMSKGLAILSRDTKNIKCTLTQDIVQHPILQSTMTFTTTYSE